MSGELVAPVGSAEAVGAERIATLMELYRRMLLIREAEQACGALFAANEIPGFIHLSNGQEAVSVGVAASLRTDDTVASTHRGHGHALTKGLTLELFFKELLGKEGGACKGRGGSMHVADLSVGMLGANGIVGGGIGIAVGSGFAHKLRGSDAVSVCFFGDGALAEGILHECLNVARLKKIPVVFVCENNGWSEFSATSTQVAFTLPKLAAAYELDYAGGDGTDVEFVTHIAAQAIGQVRRTGEPVVLEFTTTRIRGHYEGDSQKYRNDLAPPADPLVRARQKLLDHHVPACDLDQLETDIRDDVMRAVELARQAAEPTLQAAAADVYAPVRGAA